MLCRVVSQGLALIHVDFRIIIFCYSYLSFQLYGRYYVDVVSHRAANCFDCLFVIIPADRPKYHGSDPTRNGRIRSR
jgi:hypothetical protein